MKTHASNLMLGAVLTPLALAIAAVIANEAQTLIGLHLDRVALSIYLFPFLAGAAAVIAALVRLEASKIGGALGDLATTIFGPPEPPEGSPQMPGRPSAIETPPPGISPSPPPPPPAIPPVP